MKSNEDGIFRVKANFALTARLSKELITDTVRILSQLLVKCKKLKTDLANLKAILEILEH